MDIQLQIRSGELGYRYVVRDYDGIEVWTPDHMLIAEFDGGLLLSLVLNYLASADVAGKLAVALAEGEKSRLPLFPLVSRSGLTPRPDTRKPLRRLPLPIRRSEKGELRAARRRRKT